MNKTKNKKRDIQCLNCGIFGHTSRLCNSPITSYGVICFRVIDDEIKYLMIQRKDSLCYVEFVRGNYNIGNLNYLFRIFEKMTKKEKEYLRCNTFEKIWKDLWSDNRKNNVMKNTKHKYDMLSNGYTILNKDSTTQFVSLEYILKNSSTDLLEQEWEFPKGRRKLGEKDHQCGAREFSEESNIHHADLNMLDGNRYFEEVYVSMNKTRYRNLFYLGKYNKQTHIDHFNKGNTNQTKEVRDVKWLSYDEVCEKIKDRNIEKYEMFKIANEAIKKYIKKGDTIRSNFQKII